jgi:hypothetical protein
MPDEDGGDDSGVNPHDQRALPEGAGMARKPRLNPLAPKLNPLAPRAIGAPMPPPAKLNKRWRQNAMNERKARGAPTEAEEAADARLRRDALTKAQLSGPNVAAEYLHILAEALAVPVPEGRPPGSSRYNEKDFERLVAIKLRDDGSPGARGRAIAAVVDSEEGLSRQERETVKRRLRRKLQEADSADKN